jgi:hypothetical protein
MNLGTAPSHAIRVRLRMLAIRPAQGLQAHRAIAVIDRYDAGE